jgi:cyclopropane fatty-acyl-phospholipid synthase-like methyltransferase
MDKKYWENYYAKHGQDSGISHHSSFSEFCLDKFRFEAGSTIVEIGSGNGRDAIYFAHHGYNVIAIDQSTAAIDIERKNIANDVNRNLSPISSDFIRHNFDFGVPIDIFYSRFTLHAISKQDELILLPKIYDSLVKDGLFCIEVRTTKDPLFGKGEDCGDNTYLTDHRRRFIESKAFIDQVLSIGFSLLFFTEENNLSVYKDDNPVLMRIILRKS